jgi:hypothetical protein
MLIVSASPGESNLTSHGTSPSDHMMAPVEKTGTNIFSLLANSKCTRSTA